MNEDKHLMRNLPILAVLFFCLLFSVHANAESKSRFEIGTPGYLMEACEDFISNRNTFESGYCYGVYITVSLTKLLRFGNIGDKYCPKDIRTDVQIALVVKYIKNRPKSWYKGEDYIAVQHAMEDAWPCE